MSCKHEQFQVRADVNRVIWPSGEEPPAYFHVDITLNCMECGEVFEWRGLPNGFSPYQPTVSIDGRTLQAPAMPTGQVIPLGLPGFRVTQTKFDGKPEVKQ